MNIQRTVLGVVLFAIFWVFQAGYVNSLGPGAWVLGAILFVGVLMAVGKTYKMKENEDIKKMWMFASGFLLVSTIVFSYLGPYIGIVMPAGADPSGMTPVALSMWLGIYGAAILITGMQVKSSTSQLIGLIWLVASVHYVTVMAGAAMNAYITFGIITGLPYILEGLLSKE